MAHAKTQRRKGGRDRGRFPPVLASLRLERSGRENCVPDLGGMGLVSREAAKAAKQAGCWVGADKQRKQSREAGGAGGSGNLRIGE